MSCCDTHVVEDNGLCFGSSRPRACQYRVLRSAVCTAVDNERMEQGTAKGTRVLLILALRRKGRAGHS
jgi:hypothetical protein